MNRLARIFPGILPACAAALLAACQSVPIEELACAREMVEAATLDSSGDSPAPELARSQDKLRLAQRWFDARDYGPARWLAEEAGVDATFVLTHSGADRACTALARVFPVPPVPRPAP